MDDGCNHDGVTPTRRPPLTIAAVQPISALHDVAFNVERHAKSVAAAKARVVVFPELSLTGYSMDGPIVHLDDPELAPLIESCAHADSIALVGAPVQAARGGPIQAAKGGPIQSAEGGPNIATLAVTGQGIEVAYRKMYLGGSETSTFSPGSEPAALNIDGWRLGLAICKDTGVAAHAEATAALDIDVYVAGVCETEADRDVPARRAARVTAEHRVWMVVASFAGATGGEFSRTAGRSAIWRPDGSVAAAVDEAPGRMAKATLADL